MNEERSPQDELLTVCEKIISNPHPMIAPRGFLITDSQMKKLAAAVKAAKENKTDGQTDDDKREGGQDVAASVLDHQERR